MKLKCHVDKLSLNYKTDVIIAGVSYKVYYCPNGHKYRVRPA